MLKITIPAAPGVELWDEVKEEFITTDPKKEQKLELEHSLVSLSKWESKWCKPFLSSKDKTNDEIMDYIRCMTITQNVDESVYTRLTKENIQQINDYINAPMTATTFSKEANKASREIITSELIYYWMIALEIPVEFQKWHLNRLLTLIKVCNIKNQPPKKMSSKEVMSRNSALNAARKQQMNTKG